MLVLGLDAGNYLRLEADGKLIIAGQTLGGTFAIEQVTNTDGASITRIAARNVTMNLGGVVDLAAGIWLLAHHRCRYRRSHRWHRRRHHRATASILQVQRSPLLSTR